MVISKTSTNNKCWRWCGEKGTFLYCDGECKMVQPVWRTAWRFLEKLKTELLSESTIPLLGIYPENMTTLFQKDISNPKFTATLFAIAKTWKQPNCPSTDG